MQQAAQEITVEPARAEEQPLLSGMLQFYIYDFSEMQPAESAEFELEPNGLFKPYRYLPDYWREAGRVPLIIRKGGLPVGFALLNDHSHTSMPVDRNMAEFFVMRKHRRGRVASVAVQTILTAYPGHWEIAIAERNAGAKAFWPSAIASTSGVRDLHLMQGDGVEWTGPIYRFVVSG